MTANYPHPDGKKIYFQERGLEGLTFERKKTLKSE